MAFGQESWWGEAKVNEQRSSGNLPRRRCVRICRQRRKGAKAEMEIEGAGGRGTIKEQSHRGEEEESTGL